MCERAIRHELEKYARKERSPLKDPSSARRDLIEEYKRSCRIMNTLVSSFLETYHVTSHSACQRSLGDAAEAPQAEKIAREKRARNARVFMFFWGFLVSVSRMGEYMNSHCPFILFGLNAIAYQRRVVDLIKPYLRKYVAKKIVQILFDHSLGNRKIKCTVSHNYYIILVVKYVQQSDKK